ncbi:MAG TPA: sialidase family protein, partial [Polyangiaceae bacterium]|nr:sialidase family protein [Polyangiaceae bacterium]
RRDEGSLVLVDSARGAAAPKLGFGAPLPISPNGTDDENPAVILDGSGNVWAFWASRRRTTSNLWYARSDGSTWSAPKALTAGLASDREPSGAFDPSGGGRIWIAFTRRKPDGRSNIFVRTTTVLDFNALVDSDFQETEITPVPPDYDNREPALIVTVAGGVELFMASNRTNGWNVWTKTLTAGTPLVQGGDSAVTTGQETQRSPVALLQAGVLRLWFRSNAPRTFVSSVYPLTRTFDGRYSGSTSADTRNPAKQSRRRELEDLGRYVYDTGEGVTNLFARGTVGVYLTPDTDDQMLVLREQQFLADALRRIVPIQVRLVFLIETGDRELVYTYDFPNTVPDRHIGEVSFESILPEMMKELTDAHVDGANVRFLRTWVPGVSVGGLPDLAASPPDLAARLYTAAFEEEE